MPTRAPEEDRWVQSIRGLGSWIWVSFLWARCRAQSIIKRAAMAPNIAPGKKPTAIAAAGYSGQDAERSEDAVVLADFSADEDGDGTGVMVA